jgi:signal transduction histidine kinase
VRRRILVTVLAVTGAALIIFGVAFGWAFGRTYRSEQTSRLHQAATVAAAAASVEGLHGADPIEPPAVPAGIHLVYYDANGAVVSGSGPRTADRLVGKAMSGHGVEGRVGSRIAVAQPITANETTIGAVEAFSAWSLIATRTMQTWLSVLVLGLVLLGLSALVASWQSRRLTRPVDDLVDAAGRLGEGDFALRTAKSGVAEIDRAALALETTSTRLGELMQRERSFTAHASHQLRTPLTALRVTLENALETPGIDLRQAAGDAVAEVDRLQATLDELLALARTGEPPIRLVSLGEVLGGVQQRWHPVLAESGRRLRVEADGASDHLVPATVSQVLDILVDNSATHGRGTVDVRATALALGALPPGISVDIGDEGDGVVSIPERGVRPETDTNGHGLGLWLARSLTEGAGGRLQIKRSGPHPVVAVVLPA